MSKILSAGALAAGLYLILYSSRLLLLRTTGRTTLFAFADFAFEWLPWVACLVLLAATLIFAKSTDAPGFAGRVIAALLVSMIPPTLHLGVYSLTYQLNSGTSRGAKTFWVLSFGEWAALLIGGALVAGAWILWTNAGASRTVNNTLSQRAASTPRAGHPRTGRGTPPA